MAFKMRSGNKVSFKNMGGSPAKQNEGLISANETQSALDAAKRQELAEQRASDNYDAGLQDGARSTKAKKSDKDILSVENRGEKTLKDLREYNIKKEQKASDRTKALTEGAEVTDSDEDINKYKSKAQINQERKTARTRGITTGETEDRKIFGVKVGTRKYTKAERKADKDIRLQDKLKRAKGTGTNTMTFNWKDALVGGDLSSGMRYEPAHEVLQRKIDKRKSKAEYKDARKTGREDREELSPGTVASRLLGGKGSKVKKEMESQGIDRKEAKFRVKAEKRQKKGKSIDKLVEKRVKRQNKK